MAEVESLFAALMSIHPGYARQILDGSKRVEFRRSRFARVPKIVLIYETAPTQQVTGAFEVAGIDEASPTQLWRRYHEVAGLAESAFRAYYRGVSKGVAIQVGSVHCFDRPLKLAQLIGAGPPPQSFRYVTGRRVRRIIESAPGLSARPLQDAL